MRKRSARARVDHGSWLSGGLKNALSSVFLSSSSNLARTNPDLKPFINRLLLMKHFFNHLPKLAALAAIVLSVSSCNRAEYAMLPKTTPYHATYHSAAKPAPSRAPEQEKVTVAEAPAVSAEEKNEAIVPTTAPAAASPTAATVAAAPAAAAKPVAATPAPRKATLAQKLALNKVTKKLDKLAGKAQLKPHSETASANALEGNLRTGVILLLVGLLVSLLSGVSGVFGLIGGIIAIIGLIFIILYLLDEI